MARSPGWVAIVLMVGMWSGLRVAAPQAPATDYASLVEAYRAGRPGSAERIDSATAGDLEAWIDAATSRTGGLDWPAMRAAAILHTERWFIGMSNGRHDTGATHLDAAMRLFVRLREIDKRHVGFIHRWRAVVAALLGQLSNADRMRDFLSRTNEVFPIDENRRGAEQEFAAGVIAERSATERSTDETTMSDAGASHMWGSAATSYEASLRKDREFHMADLHLGRVLMMQEKTREAARHFERAAAADDPRVQYLAQLFLGSLAERAGRYPEAERSYRTALQTYPLGQSAPLALSQLFSRTGRESDAKKLNAMLARRTLVVEPLWTYVPPARPSRFDSLLLLEELRAEVLK